MVPRIHLLFASEQSYSEHPSAVPRPLFHKDVSVYPSYIHAIATKDILTLVADRWATCKVCTGAVINLKHVGGQRLKG